MIANEGDSERVTLVIDLVDGPWLDTWVAANMTAV